MNTSKLKVYLDDERMAPFGWTLVKSARSAIELLESGCVAQLSLDHDLGNDDVGTGYDVLLWIEEKVALEGFTPPEVSLHTVNASARKKMELAIVKIEKLQKQ